ncbi:bacterioferritin-associated ferredoxin [Congregibacter variabilis]|uniref:Bacterioferritin-associated ferredoxin n=1 Tax=Congregibacter variabilis TaxID=3081200 RepID=A0ABZ0HYI4_9GAMM|nr:bacterioferritin-associated ferredoxin [Congregibacter sp. IMCC43200]
MYVCICNGITDKQIKNAVAEGATSLQLLRDELGVGSQCGSCTEQALSFLDDTSAQTNLGKSLFYAAASPA